MIGGVLSHHCMTKRPELLSKIVLHLTKVKIKNPCLKYVNVLQQITAVSYHLQT